MVVNSNVDNIMYVTSGGATGFTDDGDFPYFAGETCTFYLGGILLGLEDIACAALITPVEMTGSTNPFDQAAANLYVFFQTLDNNSPNSGDGIQISDPTLAALANSSLDFDVDPATFNMNLQALLDNELMTVLPGRMIVDDQDALDNFCQDTYLPGGGESAFGYPFPGCELGADVELLTNGDFETDDADGGDLGCEGLLTTGWFCFNTPFINSNNFDSGNGGPTAHSPDQTVKMFGPFAQDQATGIYQDVPAIPGSAYTASAWAQNWTDGEGSALNNIGIMQLTFLDGSGEPIPGGTSQIIVDASDDNVNTYLPPNTWTQLVIAETIAPAGTASARVQLLHIQINCSNPDPDCPPESGGSIFWDDASLLGPDSAAPPPPPPTETDLLTNGGFELPDVSGGDQACSENWMCFGGFGIDQNFTTLSGSPLSGTQNLKQFGDDAGAFQDVDAMPGETYTVSAWARNDSSDPLNNVVLVQLFFYDAAGGNISGGFNAFAQEAGSPVAGGVETFLSPDTWVQLSASGIAPANAVTARIQVIHTGANVTGGMGGSVFWDDASLTGPSFSEIPEGFELVFFDEFNDDGPVPVDATKWTVETGLGPPTAPIGWGNNEWQQYTTNLENVRVEGGNLVIEALCTPPCVSQDGSITSGKINSNGNFDFQYGIVQARIKTPGGLAVWPAFWMLGSGFLDPIAPTPWPNAGEIDVMEQFQNNSSPLFTHSALHFCDDIMSSPAECNFENGYRFIGDDLLFDGPVGQDWSSGFHIYELEWNADRIITRVDGIEVLNEPINPDSMEEFRNPFYLILNVAMGGNLGPGGNQPPSGNETYPQTMLVDWVRVYQEDAAPPPPPPPEGDELLTNDSFELPDASGGDQACSENWMCFGGFGIDQNFTTVLGSPLSGTQNLKQFGNDAGAFQDVAAIPGETYTASAWVRNDSSDPLNNIVLLQLFFYDAAGNNISGGFTAFAQEAGSPVAGGVETFLPSNTWVQLSASGVAPANAATARIQLIHLADNVTGGTGGSVFWDDPSLIGPGSEPPPPAEEFTLFADELASGWALFLEGASTAMVITDSDPAYGQVIEFSTPGSQVVGITSRSFFGGDDSTVDASNYAVLEFDMKMTAAPATDVWRLKVENPPTEIGIDTPVLDTWVHYSIPVSELGSPAALDVLLIFADYAANAGAVYRIDNVKLLADAAPPPPPPAEEFTLFADELASGWALFLEGASTAMVITDPDPAYGQVIEFSTPGSQVVGITSRSFFGGDDSTVDASNYAVLEFDLKMTAAPATDVWRLKVENPPTEIGIDTPVLDTWVHYSIPVSELGNPAALDVLLIFADYAANAGAVYRIDNVKLLADAAPPPPPPAEEFTLFADELASGWALFLEGASTAMVITDSDPAYGQVIEFSTPGSQVVGITSRSFFGGDDSTVDASNYAVLEFDMKMTAAPATDVWRLKVENPPTEIGIDTPVLDTWVHYSIPVSELGSPAALDVLLIFADYAANAGAVYRIDNVKLLADAAPPPPAGGELTTNGDFEAGNLSGWTVALNGGSITPDNTQASGSTWTGHAVAGPANAPALSQEGLAVGTVNPGDTIDISFDMCGSAVEGGEIAIALLSEKGPGEGADRDEMVRLSTPALPSVWTRYNYSRTAGVDVDGGVSLQFDVVCGGAPGCSADVYFDNVSVTIGGGPVGGSASGESCAGGPPPPPPPTDTELLTNDSFELPDVSGGDQACSENWMCFGGFGIDQNFTTVLGSPLSGTQNLKQFGNDAGAFQDVAAIPGETYTASAWARNDSSDPLNNIVLLQLFFYDAAGNNISGGFNAFAQEAGSPVAGGVETFLPSNTWVQLSASGVAPANAATARIQLIHLADNVTGGTGGSVFWDDPSLIGPGSEPPPPAEELTLFADELASGWALFQEGAATCCGGNGCRSGLW